VTEVFARAARGGWERAADAAHLVRFSHSIFALPFAFAGVLLAWHRHRPDLGPDVLLWVAVAMVGARTAAMAFNRLVDRGIDARNPRTRNREIPRGAVTPAGAAVLTLVASALFVFAAGRLNPMALALSPVALVVVLGYSFTKRFTWGSHFFLGLGLGIAPVGGWVAVTGTLEGDPFLLSLAVLSWIAGADILYALQDEEFDRATGLQSVPARFGARRAMTLSALCHLVTVAALVAVGLRFDLSFPYFLGVTLAAAMLVYEQILVRPGDLRRLSFAFFDMNGLFSLTCLAAVAGGVFL
jgi:4-hydroxybenzoate polyprenyltransferase